MAHSLSPECTPLKQSYDSCFNTWFETYLKPLPSTATPSEREEWTKGKTKEYEEKCGKVWEAYRDCVSKAVKDRGLEGMLDEARGENPLVDVASIDEDR